MAGLKEIGAVLSAVVSLADNYDVWSVRYQNREPRNRVFIDDWIERDWPCPIGCGQPGR